MQTQQVLGVSGGLMFSSKSTSVKSSDSGFEQLIQMSQNAVMENEQKSQPVVTKKESAADVTKAEQPEKTEGHSSEKKETSATTEEQPELGRTDSKKEASDVEAAEKAAGVLTQVTEIVKNVLDLTEEELKQLMEQLGITSLELLQPETLQSLVLTVNSEQDAVILLTDAELLSTVNELLSQVEQLLQEAGVTPEELINACENPEFETLVDEALDKLKSENTEKYDQSTMVENHDFTTSKETEAISDLELHTDHKDTETSENRQNSSDSTNVDGFANHFLQNLQQAAEKIGEINGQNDLVQMIREIADQILEKVKVSVNADTTSLEIILTPEELGKVNLTVSAEQDGTMKARFVTENELAREAIERNLVQFKETLQEQGLKVDTIEVTVGNFEFDKNGQTGESSQEEQKNGHRKFMTDDEIVQKNEADQLAKVFMEGGESTVNYMA